MWDADDDRQERRNEGRESDPYAVRRKVVKRRPLLGLALLLLRGISRFERDQNLIDAPLFPERHDSPRARAGLTSPAVVRSDRRQVRERSFSARCVFHARRIRLPRHQLVTNVASWLYWGA